MFSNSDCSVWATLRLCVSSSASFPAAPPLCSSFWFCLCGCWLFALCNIPRKKKNSCWNKMRCLIYVPSFLYYDCFNIFFATNSLYYFKIVYFCYEVDLSSLMLQLPSLTSVIGGLQYFSHCSHFSCTVLCKFHMDVCEYLLPQMT